MTSFCEAMILALRQAGTVARTLQGRVENKGKASHIHMPHDDEDLRRRRAAMTVVDQIVQEILLMAASKVLSPKDVVLDAEEETPSCSAFARQASSGLSLIIDPIDGTLEYINGQDSYSICVALVDSGMMSASLVYFPARDTLYMLDEYKHAYKLLDLTQLGSSSAVPLAVSSDYTSRRVYVNGRVAMSTQRQLQAKGLDVVNDTFGGIVPPDCILSCLTGEALAYVTHTRQIRDVLLGPILAACPGGFAADWKGHDLQWPSIGRVSRAVFGRSDARVMVASALESGIDEL